MMATWSGAMVVVGIDKVHNNEFGDFILQLIQPFTRRPQVIQ